MEFNTYFLLQVLSFQNLFIPKPLLPLDFQMVSDFINERPTIKMIALAFLLTIGLMLVLEGYGEEVPKGYIYFAMVYALLVEFLNIRMRKNQEKKKKGTAA